MGEDFEPLLPCLYGTCGEVVPRIYRMPLINGSEHLKAVCPGCGRYIKFVPHVEPWLSMIEEVPEQGSFPW